MASKYKIINSHSWSVSGYRFTEWDSRVQNGNIVHRRCMYQHDTLGFVSVWSDARIMSARACFGGRVFHVSCKPGSLTVSGIRSIVSRIVIPQMERELEAWQEPRP